MWGTFPATRPATTTGGRIVPIAKLRALWRNIYDSLWFLPAIFTAGAILAALALTRADPLLPDDLNRRNLAWLFSGGPEGARGVLDAIASSFITVTGVVFSVTIVALQLASSQFTPRVLRTFMADRPNQLVLGVFISTFVYSMLVMRTIHGGGDDYEAFVPVVATTFAGLLAIIAIGFLIYYIHHAARLLQVDTIMSHVATDGLRVIRSEYPELIEIGAGGGSDTETESMELPGGDRTSIHATDSGYLTALDKQRLLRVSRKAGCALRIEVQVGDYIYPGTLLATLAGSADEDAVDDIRSAFATGFTRTPHQDVRLTVVELVDIAAKALSTGMNDPTTAMSALDRLGELLLEVGRRIRPSVMRDDEGGVIITNSPDFDDFLRLSFIQIAGYAGGQVTVSERMANVIGTIGPLLPAVRHASLRRLLTQLEPILIEPLTLPGDRDAVHVALARAERTLTSG